MMSLEESARGMVNAIEGILTKMLDSWCVDASRLDKRIKELESLTGMDGIARSNFSVLHKRISGLEDKLRGEEKMKEYILDGGFFDDGKDGKLTIQDIVMDGKEIVEVWIIDSTGLDSKRYVGHKEGKNGERK